MALGTLGANTAINAAMTSDAPSQAYWCQSVEVAVAMEGHTATEGPITVGVAHGDYAASEIEEWLENASGFTKGDMIAQEVSRRKIRVIGSFSGLDTNKSLNNGDAFKTRCGFILEEGKSLKQWAYNQDTGALTTGTEITMTGVIHGGWR